MRKRIVITVAVIGCLAFVALGLWFLLGVGPKGGTMSVGGTSVQYLSLTADGRISLVIWSDLNGGSGNNCESALFGSTRCGGFFSSPDGKRIDWQWKAPKEKGGNFQINGIPHDLANGTLFLVSTKGGQVRIIQLDVDLSNVKPDRQGFGAFAKKEPKVAEFLADASGQK